MAIKGFPEDSYRRFHKRVQINRALSYLWVLLMGYSFYWLGLYDFDKSLATISNLTGCSTSILFWVLYDRNVEKKWNISLFPFWSVIDTIAITFAVYSGHDPGSPFFMMYVLSVGAASFSHGARAALAAFGMNTVAFTVAIWLMSTPEAFWLDFKRGMLPYFLLFSMLGLVFNGISSLRKKRMLIKSLVAEKNLALEKLERRSTELEQANIRVRRANETKSKFLANVSHELRTPLNSIIGFSEILIPRTEDRMDEREKKFLRNIQISGHHLLALINDILDLAKVEAGKMKLHLSPIPVDEVMEGVCTIMQGYCRKRGVTIFQDLEENLPTCVLDQARLKQILYNLMSNAVKFSPEGERVVLIAQTVPAEESPLGVNSLKFSVTDRGPGIAEKNWEKIFDEFQKVENGHATNPEGTGLGLPLVRQFCKMMGGFIKVDSTVGEGSTFTVLLPQDAKSFLNQQKTL